MTVGELVGRNANAKIGAKDGSAFVFCGDLKTIDIDRVDEAIRNGYRATINNAESNIRHFTRKDKSYESYERECASQYNKLMKQYKNEPKRQKGLKERYTPSKEGYEKWKAEMARKIEVAKANRKEAKAKLRAFTTIIDRVIAESYKSIDEEDTMIYLFEGNETGYVWTTNEYLNGVNES